MLKGQTCKKTHRSVCCAKHSSSRITACVQHQWSGLSLSTNLGCLFGATSPPGEQWKDVTPPKFWPSLCNRIVTEGDLIAFIFSWTWTDTHDKKTSGHPKPVKIWTSSLPPLFIYQPSISLKATAAVSSQISLPISRFCSLLLISLSPFTLHSLLPAFITAFIFVLLQTRALVHKTVHVVQSHTHTQAHTHRHICLVTLPSADLSVGEIKVW